VILVRGYATRIRHEGTGLMMSHAVAVVLGTATLCALCSGASADGSDGALEILEGGSLTSSFHMSLGVAL
jgi:chemotaxis response regulator CheB